MIRLFLDPRAAPHIESLSQNMAAMPKPREIVLASKSEVFEMAGVVFVAALVAATAVGMAGRRGTDPTGLLVALFVILALVPMVIGQVIRELRNRKLLVLGACSAGNVKAQKWTKSGRSRRNEIVYEFPVGIGKPMQGRGTDLTNEYRVKMPVLVFYDPDDVSRNVAVCCTRWRIRSSEGSIMEP